MEKLYDRAEIYDLIESDQRTEKIRNDWKEFLGEKPVRTLLDVSIGSGGMTLPLQELGIRVSGSDLSEAMLARCGRKAEQKGKPMQLKCSDFRDLSCWTGLQFDCVASTGNSLGYVKNGDVVRTLKQMDRLVKPGGYLCFDSRNWEKILRERPRFYLYNPFFHEGTRINLIQVWDYEADGSVIFNLLYTFERENRIVQKEQFEEHYHPFSLQLALDQLQAMGYEASELRPFPCAVGEKAFEELEWYRLIARKPE